MGGGPEDGAGSGAGGAITTTGGGGAGVSAATGEAAFAAGVSREATATRRGAGLLRATADGAAASAATVSSATGAEITGAEDVSAGTGEAAGVDGGATAAGMLFERAISQVAKGAPTTTTAAAAM